MKKNRYIAYENGRIYDTKTRSFLKQYGYPKYLFVYFKDERQNKVHIERVHRVIAEVFIHNPDPINKTTVNHKDLNIHNNNVNNLEWMSYKENNDHAMKAGKGKQFKPGSDHKNSKFTDIMINDICYLLEEKWSYNEIIEYMQNRFPELQNIKYDNFVKQLSKIKKGERWTHISKYYKLEQKSSTTNNEDDMLTIKILV